MELTGGLANVVGTLTRLLVQLGGGVLMIVMAWQIVKVLFAGGDERKLRDAGLRLLVMGVCVAALGNLAGTAAVVSALGGAVWGAVVEAVRSGL